MDNDKNDQQTSGCVLCRWMETVPLPYGVIEYFCVNRQETITSTELSKRRCAKYEA